MNLRISQGVSISWTADRLLAATGSVERAKKSKSSVNFLCYMTMHITSLKLYVQILY